MPNVRKNCQTRVAFIKSPQRNIPKTGITQMTPERLLALIRLAYQTSAKCGRLTGNRGLVARENAPYAFEPEALYDRLLSDPQPNNLIDKGNCHGHQNQSRDAHREHRQCAGSASHGVGRTGWNCAGTERSYDPKPCFAVGDPVGDYSYPRLGAAPNAGAPAAVA